jgi:hypothetical protein
MSNEEQNQPLQQPLVSGSLPVWTEIHIQKLDINDEGSKVFWIKHPHVKWSIYDKDLVTAIKEFTERWGNDR